MSPDPLRTELRGLISEIVEVEEEKILPDADIFRDLGADSMQILEIVAAVETRYQIAFEESDLATMRTLVAVHDAAKRLLDAKG
jgi:acyl carrier protein